MAVASLSTSRPETVASLRLLGSPSRLLLWGAIVGLVIYPIVMVLIAAINPATFGNPPFRLSFSLAVTAAALGTFLGAASVRKSPALASLALIPAATPAITMAVGFILAWNGPWTAWLPLYGSALIVGLFYTVLCLPYAVQYARAGIASIPPSYEWAARIHGARPGLITRKIVAPLLWPHCLAGAILIFSISFRELIGSVLLRPPGMQTVSTFILREFDQGSPAAGMAMGVIAIAVSMLAICLARQLVPKRP
jgi:iron(III) transport system permease protein